MPNTNCLQGMQCPQCKSEGPFWIAVSATALITDDGSNEFSDPEGAAENGCRCNGCEHDGYVSDLMEASVEQAAAAKALSELLVAVKAFLERLDNLITEDFSIGGERVERERMRDLLSKIDTQ